MHCSADSGTFRVQRGRRDDGKEQARDDATVEYPRPSMDDETAEVPTMSLGPEDMSDDLHEARTMTEVGTKLDLARAYVDMGDPGQDTAFGYGRLYLGEHLAAAEMVALGHVPFDDRGLGFRRCRVHCSGVAA